MEAKKPMFNKVEQIAMVVRDARECARFMNDVYGIGPWICVQFGDAHDGNDNWIPIADVVLYGKEVGTYSIDCCCCTMPNGVELEIISPKYGESIFATFLEKRGPGIQHISVNNDSDSFYDTLKEIAEAGYPTSQLATVDSQEKCAFIDVPELLGCALEMHKRGETFEFPKVTPEFIPGPDQDTKPTTPPLFDGIDQIGIVVPDAKKAAMILNDKFGIGPWVLLNFGDCGDGKDFVKTENVFMDGKDIGIFATRGAICDLDNMQLELLEPVSEGSVHDVCLKKYGAMAQHVSIMQSLPFEEIQKRMADAGYTGGQIATIDTTETCLYSDHMDFLGLYIEAHKRPEVFIPPQIEIETYPPNLDIKL